MSRLDIRNEFFKATLENLSAEEKALRDGLPNQEYIDIIQYVEWLEDHIQINGIIKTEINNIKRTK